ncbi:hypothetical protein J9089_003272 [Salmonella enterica]|nr:hypothetical protein [Salmonella enterica]EHI7757803.1 hypothetical protein [Salmonella enterica]EHI8762946.1 hypothetical protein [Salmonella enterica]
MLKQAHEIEFKKVGGAKSPVEHEAELIEYLKGKGLNPTIKGYVMPWKGTFTKVVIDFGYEVIEEREITSLKSGFYEKIEIKLNHRKELEKRAIERMKEVCDDLEFIGIAPKKHPKDHDIYYRVRNVITNKERKYRSGHVDNEQFAGLITPPHLKRDALLDGQVVRAKDIPYQRYNSTAKTPTDVERMVIERCKELNLTYNGIVLPYVNYSTAKISITRGSGETVNITAVAFINGKTTGQGVTRNKSKNGYINDGAPTYFYLIQIGNSHLKYGVTNNIQRRFREHKRNTDLPLTLLRTHHFEDGYFADLMEEEIYRRFFTNVISHHVFKSGYTETLDILDLDSVNEFIDDFLNDKGDKDYMGWLSPKDKFNEDELEIETHFYGVYNPFGLAA